MKEFLKSVVDHFVTEIIKPDGTCDSLGLADYLFVFPNRRSALFFNHYLFQKVDRPVFAPDMTTISELFPRIKDGQKLRVLDRIELLFELFDIFKHVSGKEEEFDNFVFWGEMLLSDFNDADRYLVDTRLLFENVRDLKEIEETFGGLEEEQIKIIRTFWKNFRPEKVGGKKEVFRETWQILFELYTEFRKKLLEKNCAYDGMLQRIIVEDLRHRQLSETFDTEKERLTKILGKKVVFVGLTALSKTELTLMEHLQKYGMAEFCWDYASERLTDKNSHASYFKASTIDVFKNALDDNELKAGLVEDKDKYYEVIEVPSGVGQTVQAANILREWHEQGCDPFKTAVVLPDEKMLLPMLYSVPKEFEPFNVTMGYSLRSTAIASFVDSLMHLQLNVQKDRHGYVSFYYKNVLPLLSTNYLLKMTDGKAETLSKDFIKNNKYRLKAEEFQGNELLESVFKPCTTGKECISYLTDILNIFALQADSELADKEKQATRVFSDVDCEFLFSYISLVNRLKDIILTHKENITVQTFFMLLHKLSQSETVAFSGEPLAGLQVMGVLETRDVDFENIIILSMNEGVFPAKPSSNTFIPMNLRFAFGMPTQAHKDAVFAYHFYRLISRAKNVVMIYDSRTEGMQSGEPSRYIKQLTYLYGVTPKYKTVQYNIGIENVAPISIEKNVRVMEKMQAFKTGQGKRSLSATALKSYLDCPLEFYFKYVERLKEDDEIEESIDDKAFGNIVHAVLQEFYDELKGKLVTADYLDSKIKDKEYLRRRVDKHFMAEMKISEITGYMSLVEDIAMKYVIAILEHDREICPFEYIASEKKDSYEYTVHDEKGNELFAVSLVAIYDRLDRLTDGTVRIVDYKTGKSTVSRDKSKLEVPEISQVFAEKTTCSKEAFQLLMYSLLYGGKEVVSPNLYFVRDMLIKKNYRTELQYVPADKKPMVDFGYYREDFQKEFDKLLAEIFDSGKPFVQTANEDNCKYCTFKQICKKQLILKDE